MVDSNVTLRYCARNYIQYGLIMATKKPENMSLEATLTELETLVNQLEDGDLPVEDALKHFERGVSLVNAGQNKLAQAEQKVHILSNTDKLQPFELDEE